MPEKLQFLTSSRFWAIVIGALSIYAQSKGWIGEPEMILIATIMGGFTAIRTVDRFAEVRSNVVPPEPPATP